MALVTRNNGQSGVIAKGQGLRAPTLETMTPYTTNQTLSVIMRFHQTTRLPFLEEAIFSLAIQDWPAIEVVVVLQNGTEELRQKVIDIIKHQPWPELPKYQVLIVPIPENIDGRSTLLNRGIAHGVGRYLAFLDDDDFVYQHGYSTLIRQLIDGGRAVAVGACRRANIQYESNHWFVQSKDNYFAWGRSRFDLFKDNFVPIHSYVIDRFRLGDFDLHFDDECPPLEDYDFLLRLFTTFDPDLSQLDVPICEYRIRMDGSNSLAYVADAPPEVIAKQTRAQQLIETRKRCLLQNMPEDHVRVIRETVNPDIFKEPAIKELVPATPVQAIEDALIAAAPGQRDARAESQRVEDRRVLLHLTQEIYLFFSYHPWWELRLSRVLHMFWSAYKSVKKLAS